jgi:dihydroxy-acid dehydratase
VRKLVGNALTVTGRTLAENVDNYIAGRGAVDREVISTYEKPVQEKAGFLSCRAISSISPS